jgi:hypothetical protein
LYHAEFYDSCTIKSMNRTRRMRWARHITRMEIYGIKQLISVKKISHFVNIRVNVRIILKCIIKRRDAMGLCLVGFIPADCVVVLLDRTVVKWDVSCSHVNNFRDDFDQDQTQVTQCA